MGAWLDVTFALFDKGVLDFFHNLAQNAGGFLTPFFNFISFFGDDGIFFIILSLVLMLFKRTRKLGSGMLVSIIIGAIITNLTLKNIIARARPYTHAEFYDYWVFVGQNVESDLSFPSGHATVTMASMMALFVFGNKKYSWAGFIAVILMCCSRMYLMVHYPTDVLAGVVVGFIAGVLSYFVMKLVYKILNKHPNVKLFKFYNNFDIISAVSSLFAKNKAKETEGAKQDKTDESSENDNETFAETNKENE